VKNGAQPSESVQQLFNSVGLTKRWERVKAGESAEQVLQEAAEFYANRKVNAKTHLA
jgi:ribosomal protein S16